MLIRVYIQTFLSTVSLLLLGHSCFELCLNMLLGTEALKPKACCNILKH